MKENKMIHTPSAITYTTQGISVVIEPTWYGSTGYVDVYVYFLGYACTYVPTTCASVDDARARASSIVQAFIDAGGIDAYTEYHVQSPHTHTESTHHG